MIRAVAVPSARLAGAVAAEHVAPLSARFTDPSGRHPRNVSGDLPGFGAPEVRLAGGTTLRRVLPASRVFHQRPRVPTDPWPFARVLARRGRTGTGQMPGPLIFEGTAPRLRDLACDGIGRRIWRR